MEFCTVRKQYFTHDCSCKCSRLVIACYVEHVGFRSPPERPIFRRPPPLDPFEVTVTAPDESLPLNSMQASTGAQCYIHATLPQQQSQATAHVSLRTLRFPILQYMCPPICSGDSYSMRDLNVAILRVCANSFPTRQRKSSEKNSGLTLFQHGG